MTNLEILYIGSKGELDKERVVLKALAKVDLANYILVDAYNDGESFYDNNNEVFWFPSKIVDVGEYIRLYTKSGKNTITQAKFKEEPATFHDFYWNKPSAMWSTVRSNSAIIVQVQSWTGKKI